MHDTGIDNQRIQRWKILLQELDVDILYLKCTENTAADFLSRCLNLRIKQKKYPFDLIAIQQIQH